jgi:hypothetical protein
MKKLLVFFCVFCSFTLSAQSLEGFVFDQNNKPIPAVSVYLDGTTLGTSTDSKGKYTIYANSKINTNLVFRCIGYETFYVANPFQNNSQQIFMTLKQEALDEVIIKNDGFSRKDKLAVFRATFLGFTEAGKSCKIKNEDDINFKYDFKTNTLFASSDNPLIIENDYLEYEVLFDIYSFQVNFSKKSIDAHYIIRSSFLGTTNYNDVSNSKKIIKKRDQVYYGSSKHFFKNLSNNIWNKNEFLLFRGKFQTDPKFHFKIEDENGANKVTILQNEIKAGLLKKAGYEFYAAFNILYNKSDSSKIIFYTPTFVVDDFGNTSNISDIEFGGGLSTQKVGDMLPLDYVPVKK